MYFGTIPSLLKHQIKVKFKVEPNLIDNSYLKISIYFHRLLKIIKWKF